MKRLLSIIAFTIIVVSCTEDFINLNPISSVSVDVVYQTDKDFSDALTASYDLFQSQYQDFWMFGDIRADDTWEEIYKSNSMSYSDLFTLTSSDGLINGTWRNYYEAIYRLNTILSEIENVEAEVPNKERYIGEARFLRALAYFDLVRIFGDVPMVTTPLTIEEGYAIPREPVANIYNQVIIPDLLEAENLLPLTYDGSDVGRPTKGAAMAILGRAFLTQGDFQNAEKKLQEVTTMGYALLPNYNDLFDYTKDEHHTEYIFDIEYEEGMGEGSEFTHLFMPNYQAMTEFYGIGGNGGEHNNPTQILIDLFDSNDQRKDVTVGVEGGFYDNDSIFHELPSNTNQTYTKKYIVAVNAANDSRANWKVIRYADVLLMYAEALNENGKTDQAIPYLNQVRTRAGLTGYSTGMTESEIRNAIALERRLELSFEGVRWFDLVRTGQAYDTMQDLGMTPYMTVFPLPLSQVQLINDDAIFPQNEGYE